MGRGEQEEKDFVCRLRVRMGRREEREERGVLER